MKFTNFQIIIRPSLFVTYMGKNKKSTQVNKSTPNTAGDGPVTLTTSGDIRLSILAKPGSKISAITSIESDGIGVQIAARPIDGEANAELVLYLSKVLGLKKNEVSLEKGSKSRQKVVVISSPLVTVSGIIEKLNAVIDN